MSIRTRAALAAVVSAFVALTTVAAATPASADAAIPLPWSSFGHVLADAHGHVYVTGGSGTDGVWVRNADGSAAATITNEAGASGMTLSADGSTLYVGLRDAQAISAIDTTTLAETSRMATPGHCPTSIAVLGSALWFGDSCAGQFGRVGEVTIGGTSPTYSSTLYNEPLVLAIPGDPTSLLVGEQGMSTTKIVRYAVSGTTLTTAAIHWGGTGADLEAGLFAMAVEPDGAHLVIATGAPFHHVWLLLSDLSIDGSYGADAYPASIAISTSLGGVFVAGLWNTDLPDVRVYRAGTLVRALRVDATDGLQRDGLAISPDGTKLYAVTEGLRLHVIDDPATATATLTVSGPPSAPVSAPVSVSGTLTELTGPLAGVVLGVSRTDASGTTALAPVTTGTDGSYTVTDTFGASTATYTVSYAGDANHAGIHSSWQVSLAKLASTIGASAPTSVARGTAYSVTGTMRSNGSPVGAATLFVRRTDMAGTRTFTTQTRADGGFSVPDSADVGGHVAYDLAWGGDATHEATSAHVGLDVARSATGISIASRHAVYPYRARAILVVHLGTTYNGRSVSVFATPVGLGAPAARVATVTVNSHGDAVVGYVMTRRTTFTATFDGDYRYAPVSRSVTANVTAAVSLVPAGWSSASRGTYRFHGRSPLLLVGVTPGRGNGCVSLVAQYNRAGRWITSSTLACLHLNYASTSLGVFRSGKVVGSHWRIRAYVGPNTFSTAGSSRWISFTFV